MAVVLINTLLIVAILYMVGSAAAMNYRQKRQINVYIDETNKIATVAPQKKARAEDIENIYQNLVFTYDEVIMITPKVEIKGAYRK